MMTAIVRVAAMVAFSVLLLPTDAASQTAAEEDWRNPPIERGIRALRPAPGQPMPIDKAFQILDEDGNGVIDGSEWRSQKMMIFFLVDDDQDGELTLGEVPGLREAVFREADVDGDGRISGFEFNQAKFTQFESADTNRDGIVTFEEFTSYMQGLRRQ